MKDQKESSKVVSHFAENDTNIRHIYSKEDNRFLGTICKEAKGLYYIMRIDGKRRTKKSLEEAFRTIRRSN